MKTEEIYKKEIKLIKDAKEQGAIYLWGNWWLYSDIDMLIDDMDTTEEDLIEDFFIYIDREDKTLLYLVKECENDWDVKETCDIPELLSDALYFAGLY